MPLTKFPKWYFSIEKISAMLKFFVNLSSGTKDLFMVPLSAGEFCFPVDVPGSGGELRSVGLTPPESGILTFGSGDLEREFDFDLDLDLLFLDRELLLDDFPPFFSLW